MQVKFASAEFGAGPVGRATSRIARAVRHRTGGYELVEVATPGGRIGDADAVLAYDERTAVPALLRGGVPVAAGVGWLTTRAATDRVHGALAVRALPRAGAVWAQCSAVLPVIGAEWGVAESRLQFVPLGIDTDFYSEQPLPERPGLVMSAGEDRFRDHATLVRAVAAVRERRPEAHLELASALPFVAPDGLVTLHTERLNGRIRDLYQRSSVVAVALHPTVTGSGLTVVLEAMASGRPIVVTDNPGIGDYVVHGDTGLRVPVGDADAFAAAIETLLADDDMRIEMGRRAAEVARERFTTEVMADHLARVLRRM
jgi:glycosyltransferase involved in cell wall biosynthesis